ncbi:MAG: hypothetical protein ACOZF0_16810 [Thermodesulfobacteriota bacterium]
MRWKKWLVAIVSSVLFFPVSCATGLVVGTKVIAKLDERDARKGDPVHTRFSVVLESSGESGPLQLLRLEDATRQESDMKGKSFRMSRPDGSLDTGHSHVTYRVLDDFDTGQLVEVVESYRDGDLTIWSRYRATPSTVTPEFSKMFYFGYMFQAGPYAVVAALLLYLIGRYAKRRLNQPNAKTVIGEKRP